MAGLVLNDIASFGSNTGSGATVGSSIASNTVPAGQLVLVWVYEATAGPPGGSVSDSVGNTYTPLPNFIYVNNSSAAGFLQLFVGRTVTALGTGAVITYTKTTSGAAVSGVILSVVGSINSIDPQVTLDFGPSTVQPSATGLSPRPGYWYVNATCYSGGGAFTRDGTWGGTGSNRGTNTSIFDAFVVSGTSALNYNPTAVSTNWAMMNVAIQPAIPWAATLL